MPFVLKPRLGCFVDNLPAETLTEVFANIVTSHSLHYTGHVAGLLQEEALAFRRASQVSQFWRSVALHQCKKIWASIINIDTSSSAWVEELLRRSGNSPLTIQSLIWNRKGPYERFHTAKWNSVFAEMARVKILHASLQCPDDPLAAQLMHATSNLRAPILESFRLDYQNWFLTSWRRDLFFLNGRLFDNHCPNLRDFVLTRVPFIRLTEPKTDFSTIRLVHLEITPDFFVFDRPTVSQWLDVLETQPSLRYLTIVIYGAGRIYTASSHQVCLPNLEKLSIDTAGIEGTQILASLVLPTRCGIVFKVTEDDDYTLYNLSFIEILGETLSRFIKGWSGEGSPGLGSWGLKVDKHEESLILRFGSEDDEWNNPRIYLNYTSTGTFTDLQETFFLILSRFLGVIQRKRIVDAALSCTLEIPFPIRHDLASKALLSECSRNVTHLRLIRYPVWSVGELSEVSKESGTILFPNLRHVTLEDPMIACRFGMDAREYFKCLQSISAIAGREIPTTTLRIDRNKELHVDFAASIQDYLQSKIEVKTYVPGEVFKEPEEPGHWVGCDELRFAAST